MREGFAEPVHVLLHDALVAGVAVFAEFLEQATGDGAALGPPLAQAGLVGGEDGGAARPLSDPEFVRGGRVGQAADGVAARPSRLAIGRSPTPSSNVEGRVLLAYSIGQAAGLSWSAWGIRREFHSLQRHDGADRGGLLRLVQQGSVLDGCLLDGFNEVRPDVPAVRAMDCARGAEPSGLGVGDGRSRQITSMPGWSANHWGTVDVARSDSRSTGWRVSMSIRVVP